MAPLPQVSGKWTGEVWAARGAAQRPYLLQVCVQLLQHHFQLVHLACQIQRLLLAGKTADKVRPLSSLGYRGGPRNVEEKLWGKSEAGPPGHAPPSEDTCACGWGHGSTKPGDGWACACPEVHLPWRTGRVC